MSITTLRGPVLTALLAVGSTLVVWMLIIMAVDRRLPHDDMVVWSATLWGSAILCTAVVAYSRFAVKPVLACTIAFGLFAYGYLLFEGPIFGNVTNGGDPAITNVVVWTLVPLPIGVFVVSEVASVLGAMWRKRQNKTVAA